MISIEQLLENEIYVRSEDLAKLKLGSPEYKNAVEAWAKLIDKSIACGKFGSEVDNAEEKKETEQKRYEAEKAVERERYEAEKAVERERYEAEKAVERERYEDEQTSAKAKRREERIDRLISQSLTAAGIIVPTILTIWGAKKAWQFEETGTITSISGREFIKKIFHK